MEEYLKVDFYFALHLIQSPDQALSNHFKFSHNFQVKIEYI